MDLNKICVGIIVLVAVLGIFCGSLNNQNIVYGAEKWIKPNTTTVYMTDLYTTIHVHIKNNKDHVQYFKISQTYTSQLTTPMNWTVISTNPTASKMVDTVSPELGGDLGWKINPGETKEVTFTLLAINTTTHDPLNFVIMNANAVENTYWPLIPDPGIYSSWFQPNEIEFLNPDLDLKLWKGTFSFDLINYNSYSVSGIIRAPIVPTNSILTASSPKVTFMDKDFVMNGKVAAWDVTMLGETSRPFSYTYQWSPSTSNSSNTGMFSSTIPKTTAASTTSSVPTKETGLPYGLLVVGGIIAAGGVIYTRFMR